MFEDIKQFAGKTLDYISEKSDKGLQKACATTKYYGRQTKQSTKELLESFGYDEQKVSEYCATLRDNIRRAKACHVYPYLNPKTVATTVDDIARKILLVHQTPSDLLNNAPSPSGRYAVSSGQNKRENQKINPKDVKIVFMYQLDIMKLLEIVALDQIQKEQEDTIKRWNKRVVENKAYMDRISKIISQTVVNETKEREVGDKEVTEIKEINSLSGTSCEKVDATTMCDTENSDAEEDSQGLGLSRYSDCHFKEENERNCCCPGLQQNLQPRRKSCNVGNRTSSRLSRHTRQQPTRKASYSEIRRKLIEELEKELKSQSEEIGNTTQYEVFEPTSHSRTHADRVEYTSAPPCHSAPPCDLATASLQESTGTPIDKPRDTGALVIQVPNNVDKIVLERNGQKITVEL